MAKTKLQCPECSTYTLSFRKENQSIIDDEKLRMKKLKIPQRLRTVEAVVNKMVREWGAWQQHSNPPSQNSL